MLFAGTVSAQHDDHGRRHYESDSDRHRSRGHHEVDDQRHHSRLGSEVRHLNHMLRHVERSMHRSGATRHVWRQYRHIRAGARELNEQFRRGAQYYDRPRLLAQIRHMHDELHHIEEDLDVPAREYYQWH